LNQIVTDFLDYSREKTYDLSDVNISALLDETLTLLECQPGSGEIPSGAPFGRQARLGRG
jgi:hypothetical protein